MITSGLELYLSSLVVCLSDLMFPFRKVAVTLALG